MGVDIPTYALYILSPKFGEKIFVSGIDFAYLKQRFPARNIAVLEGDIAKVLTAELPLQGTICCPSDFPSRLYKILADTGRCVHIGDEWFVRRYLLKTSSEIKGVQLTAQAMKGCFSMLRKLLSRLRVQKGKLISPQGNILTSKDIIAAATTYLSKRGMVCDLVTVACGPYASYSHCSDIHDIRSHEPIVIDLACYNHQDGIYVDVTRTYWKGKPKDTLPADLYGKLMVLQNKPLPRVCYKFISDLFQDISGHMSDSGIILSSTQKSGTIYCPHALGHGLGTTIHQLPIVSSKAQIPFESGMLIALEPAAYLPGKWGVRVEDTFLVSDNELVNLTSGTYEPIV